MAKNWNKFTLEELTHLWVRHKEKESKNIFLGSVHPKLEITKEEMEELVEVLLIRIIKIKEIFTNESW